MVEHWCPLTDPQCRPEPTVIKKEFVPCSQELEPGKFSLRTPWGQVYSGTFAAGVLEVKIDWSTAGVDSLTKLDLAALRTSWVVHSEGGLVGVALRWS